MVKGKINNQLSIIISIIGGKPMQTNVMHCVQFAPFSHQSFEEVFVMWKNIHRLFKTLD